MDMLMAWAATNPAVTRLLWVLVLVVATLLIWALFFCCYARSRSSSPALERYLEVMVNQSKAKSLRQKKKKPKEKHVAFLLDEEDTAEEAVVSKQEAATSRQEAVLPRQEVVPTVQDVVVPSGQQEAPGPWLRKRKRGGNKAGIEMMAVDATKKPMEEGTEKPKRRPLVRAASEESSSGLDRSAVSSSPVRGDTLPWNLPKHHRIKRSKSASGDVLDAAERAVYRIADERDRVQKKTFTKWVNKHLIKAQRHITDLYEDLRDGHNLISLLEVLSGETLPREKGRMRFHKLQNVQIALDFLKHRQVKLVNIRNDDIADGNPKLTLGLIWTIILHFQISDIQVNGQSDNMTAKEKLLLWSQRMVEGYQGLRCDNFTTCWRDGKLFNAIIHKHRPTLINMNKVYRQSNQENLEQAFSVAERDLGVTRLLDPEDVDVPHPDEKSILTYVSSVYDVMPRVPNVQEGVKANELELRWQEYYELVTVLLQWIRHHILVFEERKFPASYEEIEVLWRQFLKFKETELPAKEADKNRSKHVFNSFEGAVKSGHVKIPPGYHPFDVEKEWGRLHVAILERERLLRTEFERLERLQRVVSKVQMESGVCEEQLNQVEGLLQTDMRMLSAGKPVQHTAEMEADLEKAEGMIRFLFNDVQLLKDGRHLQAEQMYRRVYRLHERLVNLRSEYNLRLKSGVTLTQIPMTQTPMTQSHTHVTHSSQVLQQAPVSVRPELDEVTLRYVQDLLGWVEENQIRVDQGEWGSDLPTVESQLGSHRGLNHSVEEFRSKIERAKADEAQVSRVSKAAYRDYLAKLELQYGKLLNSSKARLRNLDQLHAFVLAATKELMWLNEKEEEEVTYDWSERNTNMTAKKDNYSGLMRELESREKKMNLVQASGDKLLRDGHPAKKTVEAFTAALQTQWSWILQLCCCLETHLKENGAYFQFFADVKEAEERMKKIQETMKRKYTCDRSITVTRLEDLLQDAVDEREQLKEFGTHLEGLNRRAKNIVQLKPRNPATPLKGKLPIQAVCDFKQMEITVHRGDECALLDNSQPYKWRVLNDKGSEAVVPSICFLVPPTNKEAVNSVAGLDGNLQKMLTMWQTMHVDMKSLLSWQYLTRDIHIINTWNITMFKTLKVEEYRLALRNLELHYQDFLRDSQDSKMFGAEDRMQVEGGYNKANQRYNSLVTSVEQGEQEESMCKVYLTRIKDLRLKLEGCENRTVTRLRQPVDKEPLKACALKTAEQMKVQSELEGLRKELSTVTEKTEEVLASPQETSTAPLLRSELDFTLNKMEHVYSLSSVYLDKLKTIDVVIRNTRDAEDTLKTYETRLRDVNKVPTDKKEVENYRSQLKKMRAEAENDQEVFDRLQDELKKASGINDRMTRVHSERDADLEHYHHLVGGLLERWQAVFVQMDLRQRELELLGRQMRSYQGSYEELIVWLREAKQRQEDIQALPIGDIKALGQQLRQEKILQEEIETNKDKVEDCQKYAKAYIDAVKDYELQVVTYKAMQDPIASPLKKTKMESASDDIIQEYVTLRTRYSELMTLNSQYIMFIINTQRRLEEDEKATEKLKEEEKRKMAEMEAELEKQKQLADAHAKAVAKAQQEAQALKQQMNDEVNRRQDVAVDAEKQKQNIQVELQQLKSLSEQEIKSKNQQVEEALLSRTKIEEEIRIIRLQLETTIKQKTTAEGELGQLKNMATEAEKLRKAAQDEAERLRKQVAEETQKKKNAEEELKRKSEAEKEASKQKQKAMDDLQKFKMQAEEAERRMKQAEEEKKRQVMLVEEVAQKTAATELQSKRTAFDEQATRLAESLKREQGTVLQLQEEAELLKKQQEEANKARENAEKELEMWRQKANEALRLRLQAEEEALKKSQAQEEAERQKVDAEKDAKKKAKAEEAALKQKDNAEKELEKQRKLAEQTAQQKLSAEQECIRLKSDFEHAEQQRALLDNELQRLKNEVNSAQNQKKQLEDELAKVRREMDELVKLKNKAESESMSSTEKSKQLLETEVVKMKHLADEAARLRSVAEEAKKQRQVAEEEAARQRAEAEKILKEKLATINEATRLKTEAEIALKDKEAENERLKRKAEEEAYQRKLLEDQASQHKQDIEEKITLLKTSSDSELVRQKQIVEETIRQRKVVEEEIHIIKINFEKASKGKLDLEQELNKLKTIAEESQKSKLKAEEEADKMKKLASEEEKKRKEAEEKVKRISVAEQEAARQCKVAQDEVERLKAKAAEVKKQKEQADKEAEKQIILAKEAAQKCTAAEQNAQEVLSQKKEDTLAQDKLKEEYENAKKLAMAAEKAKKKAEKEAALLRQKAEEAEKQKKAAEAEAAKQAEAQKDAERLRKEAEQEASKRAEAEAAALEQKKQADAEMAKHKKHAEKTLKQKSVIEQELAKVKLQLDETDKQKSVLDEELQRLKVEVNDAVKQKAQVEEELTKVKSQMEELLKLKLKIEGENKRLMKKDKDNTQKFLAEEAEKMKSLAEDAARLSVEAQETARLRQIAEADLAEQRALAEKMLKEKMQAIQEATKLKAQAEELQKQKNQAQENAQKLLEDKQLMQRRLDEETEGFQKSLEAERKRQLDVSAEAEKLKLMVKELSKAQTKAEEEAKKFKTQAEEIRVQLQQKESLAQEKVVVEQLEVQRLQSTKEAVDLRKAITDLEMEREELKREAEELQNKSKKMADAQREQIKQETTSLQQSFLSEKALLLKREKGIEEEKIKLEKQFAEEVAKAKALKDEQERQKKQMEEENKKLQASMDAALKKQKNAEDEMKKKQKEMEELEKRRLDQEKTLAEENKKLKEKLHELEVAPKPAPSQTKVTDVQTGVPQEKIVAVTVDTTKKVLNGSNEVDSAKKEMDSPLAFDGIREKVPAGRLHEIGILTKKEFDKLKKGKVTVQELGKMDKVRSCLKGQNCLGAILTPSKQKMSVYQAMKEKKIDPNTAEMLLEAQAATGYIVDPLKNKVLSGQFDEELNKKLTEPSEDCKLFIDPSTLEHLTYKQLLDKCSNDAETGLLVLPNENVFEGLRNQVSASELLEAKVITKDLFNKLSNGEITVKEISESDSVKKALKGTHSIAGVMNESNKKIISFYEAMKKELLSPETAVNLLEAQAATGFIIDPVKNEKVTVDEAVKSGLVGPELHEKLLSAERAVNGYKDPYTGKTVSLYEAMTKGLIKKDHGIRLLEAQISTGGVIDPVKSYRIPHEVACKRGYFNDEMSNSLNKNTDETKVFYDPNSQEEASYAQLLKKCITDKETGLPLLPLSTKAIKSKEAHQQVTEAKTQEALNHATMELDYGPFKGRKVTIWEIINSEYITEVQRIELIRQYRTGYVTIERLITLVVTMVDEREEVAKEKTCFKGLRSPVTASSLFDSNIIDKATFDQLQEGKKQPKEVSDTDMVKKYLQGTDCIAGVLMENSKEKLSIYQAMKSNTLQQNTGLSLLEAQAATGFMIDPIKNLKFTVDDASGLRLLSLADRNLLFKGLRKQITIDELLRSQIIDQKMYNDLIEGLISVEEVSRALKKFLEGTSCIAGVYVESSKDRLSIYQAMKKNMIRPGTAFELLEAQAATGYVIDPIKNLKLNVNDAVKMGVVGPEFKDKLLSAERAVTGYKDPYSGKVISLFQAMKKGLILKDHGIRLLEAQIATGGIIDPEESHRLPVEAAYERGLFDEEMNEILTDPSDDTKGFFDPNTEENLTYLQLMERCMTDPETGLALLLMKEKKRERKTGVSSSELLASKIIDKETYDDLQMGRTTTQDVMLMETVKEFLEGKGSISGVAVLSTNERMSIYQAMKKGILMPGTALVLLEAQAATGFMFDPVKNRKYSVDQAIKNKVVGPELHAKLLSAERAVTGYKDPYSGETISLFQALSKDLIVKEHGIRLLEAQIATGGIIDPINSHRLPVEVAYKRGFLTEDMNATLEDSGDDTKGFFDPNTKENLTYLQLMERCVIDPATGLCLLPLVGKSDKLNISFIDYHTKMELKQTMVKVTCGKYMGMTVSLWELLMSEYFDENQRQEIINSYKQGTLTVKTVITTVLEIIEKSVKTTTVVFEGIRETVSGKQLLEANIITVEDLEKLEKGKTSVNELKEDETVSMYLQGKSSIAGVLLPNSQIMTIYQAREKALLMPGTALILLEAQAATGFVIDPIANRKFSVDKSVKAGVIGADVYQKLRSAERAVTGYKDPSDNKKISLFQAMQKDLIIRNHGIRLLEAQIATGGIIDPINSHRIPVQVAYKRGYFDEEMNQILDDPSDDTKGFFDPNTHENLTYLQLMARCVTDPSTGLCLLPLKGKVHKINIDETIRETFRAMKVTVKYGRFRGNQTTLWDLINSEYLSEDKRQELFKLYKSRRMTLEQITVTILEIVESKELKQQAELNFEGLRGKVSIVDLLGLDIVDNSTYKGLVEGKLTGSDVMKMDSVRTYLQGKSCVAGMILQPSNQKLSIYEAQKKGFIAPSTALCLLEAQAATGFIVDPTNNKKCTVEQALQDKLISPHMYEKLLSAERAVTGYKDPYTDKKISLFQALKKDLIVKEHGIRLLEAQIATGGIIDPLRCLHLPLNIAYREGYFDAELNQILTDPSDDTKGFFDPNTKANLTYMEMLGKCVKDTKTGLFLLPLNEEGTSAGPKVEIYTDEEIRQVFEKTLVTISVGLYSGRTISLWELIHSGYFTEDQRRELLAKYRTKKTTTQSITTTVISTITKLEQAETHKTVMGLRIPVFAKQLLECDIIDGKTFRCLEEGTLTLEEVSKRESVQKYLKGTGSIAGIVSHPSKKILSIYEAREQALLTPAAALILLEAQAATGFIIDPVKAKCYTVKEAAREKCVGADLHEQLLSAEQAVTGYADPFTGAKISLFEAMSKDLVTKSQGIRLLDAQMGTGGIIDPVQSHRIPLHVAMKKGYFSEEIHQMLSSLSDNTKTFFDPNTKAAVTYLELKERCEKDNETGLLLLPIYEEGSREFHTDQQTELAFKNCTMTMDAGKFQGKSWTLWEVLLSEYISKQKREQLLQQYRSGAMKMEQIIEIVTTIIIEVTSKEKKFKGLRKQVSASELYESKIISKDLFTQIVKGELTEETINKMESIQKYLGATNCIAGVRDESTKKVMSIYEAKSKGLLTPGTSLVLLEAQAATGFVIDPLNNKKLSVDEAVAQGVVGSEWKKKLLSAERAVTGYKDPYTGNIISLFQALQKDLIVKDHGVRLLEAQIATGGIIDPVHSHRVPVEVAYQRGYFDEEMNQILSDPDDDTKGFFDPNTHENLTYLQLLERCFRDPITELSLLVVVKKGGFYFFVDEATKLILKSTTTTRAGGKYKGKTVSLWDLLFSKYITEERRRELVQQYKSGAINIERFLEIIFTIIQQQTANTTTPSMVYCTPPEIDSNVSITKTTITTTTATNSTDSNTFHGIRKDVSANELLESKIIDKKLFEDLNTGKVTVTEVSEMDSVRKYLEGTNSIAGVYLQSNKETMSINQAKSKGLLTPGTSLVLLEAQAATGFIIDPVNNKKLSVEEAAAQGVIGNDWKKKLLSAERAVTGYTDPHSGKTISLFQALQKDLIVKEHGVRLLEAQIATGGIIDPVHSHRVPVEIAYQRGYFDEKMNQILSDPDDDTKGFFDPNTHENLTYLQLVERCIRDPRTGLSLLVIAKKGEFYFFVDEATKLILKSTTTTRAGGKYLGKTVSLWDLLHSKYITEEKRRELVQQYKSGAINIERFLEIIVTIIQQQTTTTTTPSMVYSTPPEIYSNVSITKTTITTTTATNSTHSNTFHGIRKDVSANELLESKIIDKKLFEDLNTGKVTVTEVSEMDSVRKYLEGTNSIAGVYLQSNKETMSINQAKSKGLLTPGTSLVLLEAQAATGFIIDPVNNKKLSVEEAAAQGVIGNDWKKKLLSAERAVTGYTDPHSGKTISLFQALQKDLIVKEHGVRLLEAQIATGGIIDPVHSHRVPVEIAYQRGYFDEKMNQILSDPDDDTKGFFDPNTHENLTYLQLVERCIRDPRTGLSLLVIAKKGEFYFFVDEATKLILKSTTTTRAGGKYLGKTVSLWDLLHSKYITEEKRRELVQQYKSGAINIERFLEIIVTIIQQQTTTTTTPSMATKLILKSTTTTRAGGKYQGNTVSLWDLLHSKYITEEKRRELVQQYKSGAINIERFLEIIVTIIQQQTTTTTTPSMLVERCIRDPRTGLSLLVIAKKGEFYFFVDEATKLILKSTTTTRAGGKYQGKTVSLWDLLHSKYITEEKRRELVQQYKSGAINIERFLEIIVTIIQQQTATTTTPSMLVERCIRDPRTGLSLLVIAKKGEFYFFVDEATKLILKSTTTTRAGGKYQGNTVSLWDLLHSKYITEEKRRELVQQYKSGAINIERFLEIIVTIIQQQTTTTTTPSMLVERCIRDPRTGLSLLVIAKKGEFYFFVDEATKLILKSTTTTRAGGKYQGKTVSLWDLLHSKYITEEKRRELVQQYKSGAINIERFLEIIVTIIQQQTTTTTTPSMLVERCIRDPRTGLSLLVIAKKGEFYFFVDEATKLILKSTTTTRAGGKYQGKTVSLWDLLHSKYITEAKRRELVQQYKSGAINIERFLEIIVTIIQQQTTTTTTPSMVYSTPPEIDSNVSITKTTITTTTATNSTHSNTFHGIRKDVSANELLESKIIDKKLFEDLNTGKVTVTEVSEMDSVRKYLEGTNSIAGVYLQSNKETMSINQAKSKGLLTPGTSLVLLEAQAATGFIIDPVNNKKLSVEEAAAQGVIGNDWKKKLLSAERAVTGYTDPHSGKIISLFQALQTDLIVKEHGVRLLEAQIATGGIIDPVHSHRVPVEIAYQRGYFDEKMNQILSDPDDDTKGFFDPNTHENLTYLQLVERCIRDPRTGLSLLPLNK
ncbi:unnamed protein product [Lota lota]